MASSRRRERQLARRRYERRQLAVQERRRQTRHRNSLIGTVVGVAVVVVVLVLVGINVFSSSSSSKKSLSVGATASASPSASSTNALAAAPTRCATISPDPAAAGEPTVPQVSGKAPTSLVSKNVKVGTGATAKTTDTVTVQYVGAACSTGKVFDASYTDGAKNKDFTFTLGQGQVIKGWDEGVPGMKVGGYRELVIPASLGYGTAGSGPIKGNETLIFLIHLVSIQK